MKQGGTDEEQQEEEGSVDRVHGCKGTREDPNIFFHNKVFPSWGPSETHRSPLFVGQNVVLLGSFQGS